MKNKRINIVIELAKSLHNKKEIPKEAVTKAIENNLVIVTYETIEETKERGVFFRGLSEKIHDIGINDDFFNPFDKLDFKSDSKLYSELDSETLKIKDFIEKIKPYGEIVEKLINNISVYCYRCNERNLYTELDNCEFHLDKELDFEKTGLVIDLDSLKNIKH